MVHRLLLVLVTHLSCPGALTNNELLVRSYFWRIVVDVQDLDRNRDVTEQVVVVCGRERWRSRDQDESQGQSDDKMGQNLLLWF